MDNTIQAYSEELKKLGIEHKVFEHPYLIKPEEVQSFLGETVADCVASLVMKADNQFIVVLKKGDDQINLKKLKKILHVSDLRLTTKEEFEKVTSLPFGAARVYIPHLKTYIDKHALTPEYRNGGTGSFTYTFKYKTQDLLKIPQSEVIDISEENRGGRKRVLSGIRATGRLHLGNYLGAVKGMLALQNDPEYETLYMVADVHAVTTPYNVEELRKNRREVIIDYLAAGLDPQKSVLFQQADVSEHLELAFYFSSVVTIARMQHLPTFKDKVKQYPEAATMALLNYPILMASDILIYKAGLVPVGIDQEPHLEVSREIAGKMNQLYGTDFSEPKRFRTAGEYVPSLTGEGKMSKSVEGSYINLTDDSETIKKKVAKIPTDSGTVGGNIPQAGGVGNLFTLLKLFTDEEVFVKFVIDYREKRIRYSEMKQVLSEAIFHELQPLQEKRKYFEEHPEEVDQIIKEGNEKAREIAKATVREVREKMGLL